MVKRATGSITLADMTDVISSPTKPTNPTEGTLWFNETDGKLYVYTNGDWKFSADGLIIGGRNILKYTGNFKDTTGWNISLGTGVTGAISIGTDPVLGNVLQATKTADTGSWWVLQNNNILTNDKKFIKDKQYTLSFMYKSDIGIYVNFMDANGVNPVTDNKVVPTSSTWTKFVYTFTAKATGNVPVLYLGKNNNNLGTLSIVNIMLEEGNKPSSWSASPEEVQSQIDNVKDSVDSLGSDSRVTRFERSLVRGWIADIIGKYLGATDMMPPLSDIDNDTYNAGKLYSIRRSARKIGLNIAESPNYKKLGDAYTALATYLTSLTPVKPWDVSTAAIINLPDRVVWNAKWNDYYNYYALFEIEVQDRQKAYSDQVGLQMKTDTIAAISTTGNHESVPMSAPTTNVKPPISTLGLPEFEGNHIDSWTWNGRNILRNGNFSNGTTYFTVNASMTSSVQDDPNYGKIFSFKNTGSLSSVWRGIYYYFKAGVGIPTFYRGDVITISFMYRINTDVALDDIIGVEIKGANSVGTIVNAFPFALIPKTAPTGVWTKYTSTATCNQDICDNPYFSLWIRQNGSMSVANIKVERGTNTKTVFTPAPEDAWNSVGNRIRPVTNPIFSSGTDLTLWGKFYGDGTDNDLFYWDTNGNAIKIKKWVDTYLNATQNWAFKADYTGYKTVMASGFSSSSFVDSSVQVVKHDGSIIPPAPGGVSTAGDQFVALTSENTLRVTVLDTSSGWGETYTPTNDEVKAYFLGWKMCNGTWNTNYTGTGSKVWYPIGDKDLSRATKTGNLTAPTDPSPAIGDRTIDYYQIIYRLVTPVQETVSFDGILELLAGDNIVSVYYPDWTPPILKGSIKYGTNLATVNQDTRYLIPAMAKRISNAEQKITDNAIISTVTQSVEYTLALKNKANASDLGNLATRDEVSGLSSDVDGRIKDAMGKLDFSPYATKSELKQTATDITAKFNATGGMNLIKNSIGYSVSTNGDIDFWGNHTTYKVTTIANAALDSLGFGKGFYFKADTKLKGITQTVPVIPKQPYTLGWYLNKMTAGADNNYSFQVQIVENGVVTSEIAPNMGVTTNGFEGSYMTFTPTATSVTVRFIGNPSVEAMLSGVMLNIGDIPLQWSLATGELYNTNIRMNINGIRVSQIDGNGSEIGYTQITPYEFAGYYQNNGSFEKVFYLNGDETVTKKLRATNEITLGGIKVINISSTNSTGWAFVPNNS